MLGTTKRESFGKIKHNNFQTEGTGGEIGGVR